jgi:hypothetical protein
MSLRSKLAMVTRAFFDQRDFTKIELLSTFYDHLAVIPLQTPDSLLYQGISVRELVYRYKSKTLQLFKALLLEKRVTKNP